ncbi:hypothetical protein Tco_1168834 [Tanacetum coccineum]
MQRRLEVSGPWTECSIGKPLKETPVSKRGVKISPNSRVARLRPASRQYMLGSLLFARQWHVHESEVVEVAADQYEDNTIDAAHVDDSKVGLQREQAMVYARALVAGLETDDLARVFC